MKKILFYPYVTEESSYVGMMRHFLSKHYRIADYYENRDFIDGSVSVIYLNWFEDTMDEIDKEVLISAKRNGIKIIWVFHNRVSHNRSKREKCLENIKFLANIATSIIVHSKMSSYILEEYDLAEYLNKIVYIPHPNYIDNYGFVESKDVIHKAEGKKCIFGFIGNVRDDKNALLAIKAFKRMKYKDDCMLLISGKASSAKYAMDLLETIAEEDNILFENKKIKNYMMGFYLKISDVIIMPYDTSSCMNSGVMILAFSNKKTVITSDMSMAMDYSSDLIYRYRYVENEDAHLRVLTEMMERVYKDGRNVLCHKGNVLYQDVTINNSKQLVEDLLVSLIGRDEEFYIDNNVEMLRCDATKKRGRMSAGLLAEVLEGNYLFKSFAKNNQLKVGIYAWGRLGQYVKNILDENGIKLTCIIDKNKDVEVNEIPIFDLNSLKLPLDVVIVTTPLVDFDQVKRVCLANNSNCYVIDLEDLE